MALLQQDKAHYYHPLNDATESLQALSWTLGSSGIDTGSFVAGGKVSNGLEVGSGVGTTLARVTYSPATPSYAGGFDGETAVGLAFWIENYFAAGNSKAIFFGYGAGDSGTGWTTGSTVVFNKQGGLYDMSWNPNGQFSGSNRFLTGEPSGSGWNFVVADMRTEQPSGKWRMRISYDGAAFTDLGLANTTEIASGTHAMTYVQISRPNGGEAAVVLDEVAVWSGHDLFTTQELANLYDLGATFGEGLDQYEENFGAPLCWQATARMPDGSVWRDSGGGPCPPVIRVPAGAADVVVTDDGRRTHPRVIEG